MKNIVNFVVKKIMVNNMKTTKLVKVGNVNIGGGSPISIQSMTNTKTENIDETVKQIKELEEANCQIIRIAVPGMEAANSIKQIKEQINIPLVADIHFNYKLALKAIEKGADKIRINPGNIGDENKIRSVIDACKSNNVPIRIGINSGSLEKDILDKTKYPTAEGMVESAKKHIRICENNGFTNFIVALKSSSVPMMIKANRLFAKKYDYPLHLGVTEAGPRYSGTIKSAIGIGALLSEGIGDTIRVSLSDDPVQEVNVAYDILKMLEIKKHGINIISCPTCGRISYDLFTIVNELEKETQKINKNLTVAVMGCIVNGPGEAKGADIAIAGISNNKIALFIDGKKVKIISNKNIVKEIIVAINNYNT